MFLVSNTKMVIEGMKGCGGLYSSLKFRGIALPLSNLEKLKCQEVVLVII
jgi:hypothetical protein